MDGVEDQPTLTVKRYSLIKGEIEPPNTIVEKNKGITNQTNTDAQGMNFDEWGR